MSAAPTDRCCLLVGYYLDDPDHLGALRLGSFARQLAGSGWTPWVVTRDHPTPVLLQPPSANADDAPTAFLPMPLPRNLPEPLIRMVRWGRSLRALPDGNRQWWRMCVAALARSQLQPEFVLATGPPFSALLVGLDAARRFGVPFIADFRDPWTDNPRRIGPTPWHRRRHRAWERQVIDAADLSLVATPTMGTMFRRRFPHRIDRIRVLTNGYQVHRCLPALVPPGPDDGFHLIHTGTFYRRNNSPLPLVRLVARLRQTHPELFPRLTVSIFGRLDRHFSRLLPAAIAAHGLQNSVRLYGPVPKRAADGLLLGSDMAYLHLQPGRNPWVMTTKIFDYVGARLPVLGVLPPGDCADLVRDLSCGRIFDADQADQQVEWLAEVMCHGPGSDVYPEASQERARLFDRAHLAARLTQWIDELL